MGTKMSNAGRTKAATRQSQSQSHGITRARSRQGVKSDHKPAVAIHGTEPTDPSLCDRCGALFTLRTWRQRNLTAALLAQVTYTTCPACTQVAEGQFHGRVLLRGDFALAHEDDIRKRIANIAEHAAHTQPERRVVSVERDAHGLEVRSTSQKLAHRIAHEIKKLYRGRVKYAWSDSDGSLVATWTRES